MQKYKTLEIEKVFVKYLFLFLSFANQILMIKHLFS